MNCIDCTLDHIKKNENRYNEILEQNWLHWGGDTRIIEDNQVTCSNTNPPIKYKMVPNQKCDDIFLKLETAPGCRMPRAFCPSPDKCNAEWFEDTLKKYEVEPYKQ